MTIAETDRLYLRHMSTDDAAFILELVNEPAWLEFIGDRGVRHLDDARAYIANGPIAMLERHGFGLSVVIRKADLAPIGICGLLKRDTLDDVDLGFAVLARYRGHSYARERPCAVASLTELTRIHAPGIGHHHHRRASGLLASSGTATGPTNAVHPLTSPRREPWGTNQLRNAPH